MAGASFDLQKAVFIALSMDSALTAKLGGTHIMDHVPPGTAFPYITLGQSSVYDWSTASEPGEEHLLSIHIWAKANGRRQVLELIDLVASRLENPALPLTNHHLVSLMLKDIQVRNDDGIKAYQGIMRYRAITERLA